MSKKQIEGALSFEFIAQGGFEAEAPHDNNFPSQWDIDQQVVRSETRFAQEDREDKFKDQISHEQDVAWSEYEKADDEVDLGYYEGFRLIPYPGEWVDEADLFTGRKCGWTTLEDMIGSSKIEEIDELRAVEARNSNRERDYTRNRGREHWPSFSYGGAWVMIRRCSDVEPEEDPRFSERAALVRLANNGGSGIKNGYRPTANQQRLAELTTQLGFSEPIVRN